MAFKMLHYCVAVTCVFAGAIPAYADEPLNESDYDGSWKLVAEFKDGRLQEPELMRLDICGSKWEIRTPFDGDFSRVPHARPSEVQLRFTVRYGRENDLRTVDYLPQTTINSDEVSPQNPLWGRDFTFFDGNLINDDGPALRIPALIRIHNESLVITEPATPRKDSKRPIGHESTDASKTIVRIYSRIAPEIAKTPIWWASVSDSSVKRITRP